MFGWIKESAVYEAGLIGSGSWDEESSSYKVNLPKEVLEEAVRVIDKGYLFLVHGTIVANGGSTEMYLQASKVERQVDAGVETVSVSFADGSTLTENLLTVKYGEGESAPAIQNIWDSTGEGAVAGGSELSVASGTNSFAFGNGTIASGNRSHAEGNNSIARGDESHAEGYKTEAGEETYTNPYMHAEGNQTKAIGDSSHSEGERTTAYGTASHAEGLRASTYGTGAHAEGTNTKAGIYSTSMAAASHAEGDHTEARSAAAHAEGYYSKATGLHAHAEGQYTEANGADSHAEGFRTIANGERQHVGGYLNIADTTSIEIIGNGTGLNARSNARTLDASGNEWLAGQIQPENGLRLKAPNGTYYNVTVDNTGALSITALT